MLNYTVGACFVLPNGKRCGFAAYVKAWKELRRMIANGQGNYAISGFGEWPQRASDILQAIKEGVDDRVNKRSGLVVRDVDPLKYLWKRIKAGRIVRSCHECGQKFHPSRVCQEFCCPDCARSYG